MNRIYVRVESVSTGYVDYPDYDTTYQIRSGRGFFPTNSMSSWAAGTFANKYSLTII